MFAIRPVESRILMLLDIVIIVEIAYVLNCWKSLTSPTVVEPSDVLIGIIVEVNSAAVVERIDEIHEFVVDNVWICMVDV